MRSREFEREFLAGACRKAGVDIGFEDICRDRLEEGHRLYEDRALDMSIRYLLKMVGEEGADVATWAVLAAQSKEMGGMDGDKRMAVIMGLQECAALGARIEWILKHIRDDVL